jgi:putative AlgH/UPF0301 family transcriptional regulator
METVSLANHFLIAMPAMDDPNFSRTLTFICEHNADGAIGIIVNRPTDMNLAGLFDRVSIPLDDEAAEARFADLPVYFGGPVQTDRGFVLHRPGGAVAVLAQHQRQHRPHQLARHPAGHGQHRRAGRGAGQPGLRRLDRRPTGMGVAQNSWLTVAADAEHHFHHAARGTPAGRHAAARRRFRVALRSRGPCLRPARDGARLRLRSQAHRRRRRYPTGPRPLAAARPLTTIRRRSQ